MDQEQLHDVVVVGSGLTGAQACQTLVEAGLKVVLLDAGIEQPERFKNQFSCQNFLDIRKSELDQRKLFLGKELEGIPWGELKTGAQLTPSRKYVSEGVSKWLKIFSDSFFPMESLAWGGLGNAWGAGCYEFSKPEIEAMGYQATDFEEAYQKVGSRIGVTKPTLDAGAYTCNSINLLEPISIERKMKLIEECYNSHRNWFNAQGFHLGRPAMAITTTDYYGRKAYDYQDMDFWHDNDRSVYRPWITLESLEKKNNLQVIKRKLVHSFSESENGVQIVVVDLNSGEKSIINTKKLILCSGVLGTARIVLRSFNQGASLSILCNPYTYVPMLQWKALGATMEGRKSSMGQLVMFHDPNKNNMDVSMAAMFTYRSLMLFRLIKEVPFNFSDGRILTQYLAPAMVIAGIHHSEKGGGNKILRLKADDASPTGDMLVADYHLSEKEKKAVQAREKSFFRAFRKLGCMPIKKVNPGNGSSIHYVGTLPIASGENPFTVAHSGRLNSTKNVYIGDGSSFKYLPAKGISFTLMANAHRVAENLVEEMIKT